MSTSEAATLPVRHAVAADAQAVLRLFDEAIAWFLEIGNTRQWGTDPVSGNPRWVRRADEWCSGDDSWVVDHPELGVCGIIALGDAVDYVPAVAESELYVQALVGSRDPRVKGIGRRLLRHADVRAAARNVGLLRVDCYAGGSGDLIRFYEACGYARADDFVLGAEPNLWPGQVLERRLAQP
jgi:GNAT superfamily N-acetyltransferase